MSFPRVAPLLTVGLSILMACSPSSPSGTSDSGGGGKTDAKGDGGTTSGFQPSNITLASIMAQAGMAADEDVENSSCGVQTISTNLGTFLCFTSPVTMTTEPFGSGTQPVALLVVKSLKVGPKGAISVAGNLPLVIVSLGDVTLESGASISAGSANSLNMVGPGGAAPQGNTNSNGTGPGGGPAGSLTSFIGAGGGSFCGVGGAGGGTAATAKAYGSADIRPLQGGSSGGSGTGAPGSSGGGAGAIKSWRWAR